MNKRCVVTVAFREMYTEHQKQQENAIRLFSNVDIVKWIDELPSKEGLITEDVVSYHQQHAYSFKPYAIQLAMDMGYESIIWLDPSVVPMDNIDFVFDYLENNSMVIANNEEPLYLKCMEWVANWFGTSRNEMNQNDIKHLAGSIFGFNMKDDMCLKTFRLFQDSEKAGCFGTQDDMTERKHMVDETCMGLSVWKTGVKTKHCSDIIRWASQKEQTIEEILKKI